METTRQIPAQALLILLLVTAQHFSKATDHYEYDDDDYSADYYANEGHAPNETFDAYYEDNPNFYQYYEDVRGRRVLDSGRAPVPDDPPEEKIPYLGKENTADSYLVPEGDWNKYWPPKKPDGTPFKMNSKGLSEWNELKVKQEKTYEEYLKLRAIVEAEAKSVRDSSARPYPYCVDGTLPNTEKDPAKAPIDPDLARFKPYFGVSQPVDGRAKVADRMGRPLITHLEDGVNRGSYVQEVTLSNVLSEGWYNEKKYLSVYYGEHGSVKHWVHIFVKSRVPLEGLYIQAIGYPMGLPFGEFRTDIDCNIGNHPDLKDIVPISKQNPDQNLTAWKQRRNIVVPCKYMHGNNNGDVTPTVFAYGGHVDPMPARKTFRTLMFYSNSHCNLKMRMQFLILAVRNFNDFDYEAFLTATYIPRMSGVDGVPYPDGGFLNDLLYCNHTNVVEISRANLVNEMGFEAGVLSQILYVPELAPYPISYDINYDNCIVKNEGWLGSTQQPPLPIGNLLICPPSKICLNSDHPIEGVDKGGSNLDSKGGEPRRNISGFFVIYRRKYIPNPDCIPQRCKDPKDTEPKLILSSNPIQVLVGRNSLGREFMESFVGNSTLFLRGSKGTHVWSMVLSWFILMAVGTFMARFYKETAGLDRDLNNGCFGIGFWIWVHILLMVFSLGFMWIGLLDTISIKRSPAPCSSLAKFKDMPELKRHCRGRKQIIRYHRKIGIASVVFYHLALLFAWARPDSRIKFKLRKPILWFKNKIVFNFRKIFIWAHVLFAYFGKMICFIGVMIFFAPASSEICNEFPIEILVIEGISVICFAIACIIMFLEDRAQRNRHRRIFPVVEAIEVQVDYRQNKWYWINVAVAVVTSVLHLTLFILVIVSCRLIYSRFGGKGSHDLGAFETFKGMLTECKVESTASQIYVNLDRFFYTKKNKAS